MSICNKPASRSSLTLFPAICTLAALAACDPYPEQGEFLAGVIFPGHFITGVQAPANGGTGIAQTPAVGQGKYAIIVPPYMIFSTTGTGLNSPLWTDGKRDPLLVANAQVAFVFDGQCQAPAGYQYSEPLDLIRLDQQYPIFQDIPESFLVSGKVGRMGAYSAIVEVRHVTLPAGFSCQSVKRFDTVMSRSDLSPAPVATKEYRLLQIFDPSQTMPPIPYQLGFFNQLVVPYIDMGPVPLTADGSHFASMPVFDVTDGQGNPAYPIFGPDGTPDTTDNLVVLGLATDMLPMGAPAYSPVCQGYSLTVNPMNPPVPDATSAAFNIKNAKATALSACLVCRTTNQRGDLDCPFANSGGGKR